MTAQETTPPRPLDAIMLAVGDGHWLYVEEVGRRGGIPALFLHGGPGSGAQHSHRTLFDANRFHAILFDQRGAGRSHPYLSTHANTTQHLVADIERIRTHFGFESMLIVGGSWGSTLALAYAQAHPERCLGLALRGIFLCRPSEIDWFLYGLRAFFPEAWGTFAGHIPEPERGDLLGAYHRRLMDPDPAVHRPAARAWSIYEGSCSTLLPSRETVDYFAGDGVALGLARMEAHYFAHNIFLPDNALLANVGRIRHLPAVIVQGRYDAVCPIVSAHELHQAWPEARYVVVPDAGHSAWEPGIRAELVRATEEFKAHLRR